MRVQLQVILTGNGRDTRVERQCNGDSRGHWRLEREKAVGILRL